MQVKLRYNIVKCHRRYFNEYDWTWSPWSDLNINLEPEKVAAKLAFWRTLNDYAVSQRGESAKAEFKAVLCEYRG